MPDFGSRKNHRPKWLFLVWTGVILALCPASSHGEELLVSAAASLTEAFNELGSAFAADNPDTRVVFNFAGSQLLRSQIERGAPVDVFASADGRTMAALREQKLACVPESFAGNRLVLIVNQRVAAAIPDFAAAAKPGRLLAVGAPQVPIGAYTRNLLDAMAEDPAIGADLVAALRSNIVTEETSVKAVLAKVVLGEVDAGIVYQTDLTPAMTGKVVARSLPAAHNPLVAYPIAGIEAAPHRTQAAAFLTFVLSPQGQRILQHHGFLPARDGT